MAFKKEILFYDRCECDKTRLKVVSKSFSLSYRKYVEHKIENYKKPF